MRREPLCQAFIFVLDISQSSIQNGFLLSVIESIKDILSKDLIKNPTRTKVTRLLLILIFIEVRIDYI